MKKTIIKGTGRYLPTRLIKNDDLTEIMDTSDEWITKRTGIRQRFWVEEGKEIGVSDLAFEASKVALQKANWNSDDLDLIIFATLSPDMNFPGSGCILQHKLGASSVAALDIRQQCTGFLHGLEIADAYIKSKIAKRILLVGAEIHSNLLDLSTNGRDIAVLFGDGAGVVCLEGIETDQDVGILQSTLHADGQYAESLMIEIPSSKFKSSNMKEMIKQGKHYPKMNGRQLFKYAVRKLPEVVKESLAKINLSINNIDMFIPHQANLRINQACQKALDIPDEKIFNNMQRYGNTTAASIPIALDEAMEMGITGHPNDTIMFFGLGAGLTWGSVIYRFPAL